MLCCLAFVLVLLNGNKVNAEKANKVPEAPIVISNVKMSKTTVTPKEKLKYSFAIKDMNIKSFMKHYTKMYDVYGESVDQICLAWYGPGKQQIYKEYKWKGTSKNKQSLTLSDEIKIGNGTEAGEWHLGYIRFYVSGKNDEFFEVYDIRHSRNEEWKDEPTPLMDFSAFDFAVTDAGRPDYAAPQLKLDSIKVSKSYLNRNQKSTFSIKVKDRSEIEYVECTWSLYKNNNYGKNSNKTVDYKMKYNKKKKCYECKVKFDTTVYRKAELHAIWVQDVYGNWKRYEAVYNDHKKWNKYYKAYREVTIMKK